MGSCFKSKTSQEKYSSKSSTNLSGLMSPIITLTKEFFGKLIKTESEFHSNNYTVETLNELVQLYAKAVQYYDSIQDEISSYFSFKIQDVLATQLSMKILVEKKEEASNSKFEITKDYEIPPTNIKQQKSKPKLKNLGLSELEGKKTIKESFIEESSDEEGEKVRREEWEKLKGTKKTPKSFELLKSQRQKFVQFFQKFEVEKSTQQQDMHVVFNDYTKSIKDNDLMIQNAIEKQRIRIRQKIEQRKNNNLLSYTMNNSMASPKENKFGLSKDIYRKDFLANLEDDNTLSELDENDSCKKGNFELSSEEIKEHSNDKKQILGKKELRKKFERNNIQLHAGTIEDFTPTEKLSTENSFNNDLNANLPEAENS